MPITRKKSSKQILHGVTSGKKALQDPKIVEPKNRRSLENQNYNKSLMEQEVYKAIDWMKEGISTEQITSMLKSTINQRTKRVYAPRFVENIITAANQLLNLYYKDQIYKIEKVHIARYNKIIVHLLNIDYEAEYPLLAEQKPWLLREIEVNNLFDILQALKQKETLLGMHRKTFKVILNTQNNITVSKPKKSVSEIDVNLLSLDEQIELLELISYTSRSEDEVYGVILSSNNQQESVIDVDVEVVQETNIDQIERYKKKDKNNTGYTLQEIQDSIQNKLLKAANQLKS